MGIYEIEEDSSIAKFEECAGFYPKVCVMYLKVGVMHNKGS